MQSAAAASVDLVAYLSHPFSEFLEATGFGWVLTTQEGLLRERREDPLGNDRVCLETKLFDDLVSGRAIKNVMLNGNVLVVKLVEQPKRGDLLLAGLASSFTEFLCDGLLMLDRIQ